MNLLDESWIPVRFLDGGREWVKPEDLGDPRIVAFDAARADFNGALAQFAIGLLQTTSLVNSPSEWQALFDSPPDAKTLRSWFEPHAAAFVFDGDAARFMQDFSLRCADHEPIGIGNLLIEAPGENALKNNSDHFIKRGLVQSLCPHCAALALFTLQVNAPSGGAGHRTGLRGGGPLTTLLVVQSGVNGTRSLWHDLWINVMERGFFLGKDVDASKVAPNFTFPWLADIASIQKDGGEVAPIQVHPAHVFWGMPRRIRLDFDQVATGECDVCGRVSERLVCRYVTRNYGLNYKGPWVHPLSPYYEAKDGWLPLHPQPGGIGYRHWLGWVLGLNSAKKKQRRARVFDPFLAHRGRRVPGQLRVWAFGYDMDNMKARCWYEATLPLYGLNDCGRDTLKLVEIDVGHWLAGADLVSMYLRNAVKDAWFGGDARGDFSFSDAAFWSCTESLFYRRLKDRIEAARTELSWDRLAAADAWRDDIARAARNLFDRELVGAGDIARQNPARVARAFRQLQQNLSGQKLREALDLPAITKETKSRSSKPAANAAQ